MSYRAALLVTLLVAIDVALLFLTLRPERRGRRLPGARFAVFALANAGVLLALVVGAWVQSTFETYSLARQWIAGAASRGSPVSEPPLALGGDPGLVELVLRQGPARSRPDPKDVAAFRVWQGELRRALQTRFDLARPPTSVRTREISSDEAVPGLRRTLLAFTSFDGTEIPAYLLTPDASEPLPALLVLHGHVGRFEDGISQTAGLASGYHNSAALELARAGFVTLTPTLRGFGSLGPPNAPDHNLVAYNAIAAGSSYPAVLSRDLAHAVALLRSRPEVDPGRIGITGVSLGGLMAVIYAALDESVSTVVYQGAGPSFAATPGTAETKARDQHLCHVMPGQSENMRPEDWLLLVTPRPLMGVWGEAERSRGRHEETLRSAYAALGAPGAYAARVEPGGHEYHAEPAIRFFDRHLREPR